MNLHKDSFSRVQKNGRIKCYHGSNVGATEATRTTVVATKITTRTKFAVTKTTNGTAITIATTTEVF